MPIDSSKPDAFDPMAVPTVTELLGEIDKWNVKHSADSNQVAGTYILLHKPML